MKAVGFFLAVFLSMLAVFLLATGEARRWLTSDPSASIRPRMLPQGTRPGVEAKNLLVFPYYDVDRHKLKFEIRAEFSQEEVQVDTPLVDIGRLTLQNGQILVPLTPDGLGSPASAPSSAPAPASSQPPAQEAPGVGTGAGNAGNLGGDGLPRSRALVLEFASAVYRQTQDPSQPSSKRFEVLLQDGKGKTDDGSEFRFEEMLFRESGEDRFELSSSSPVRFENGLLGVHSPTGFHGTLDLAGGADRSDGQGKDLEPTAHVFVVEPPVSAILDPVASRMLLGDGARGPSLDGSNPAGPAGTGRRTSPGAAPSAQASPAGQKLALTCQGPLTLRYQEATGGQEGGSRVDVSFERDVVLYPSAKEVQLPGLPPPRLQRFDCQVLELVFSATEGRPLPQSALAVWPGGRVRATFQEDASSPAYVLDAERLEWQRLDDPRSPGQNVPTVPGRALSGSTGSSVPEGVALLEGRPTLRGSGLLIESERARFLPGESLLRLESVRGTVEGPAREPKAGARRARRLELPGGSWSTPPPPESPKGAEGDAPEGKPGLPQVWDVAADEADVIFEKGVDGGDLVFSRLVARSQKAGGVEIRGRQPTAGQVASGAGPPLDLRASGRSLTYFAADERLALEGEPGERPRFTQGKNWIESATIDVAPGQKEVSFRGGVTASLDDPEALKLGLSGSTTTEGGERRSSQGGRRVELTGQSLSLVFLEGGGAVESGVARGAPGAPLQLRVISPSSDVVFEGMELRWDGVRELAQLLGSEAAAEGGPGPTPPVGDEPVLLARIGFSRGEVLAQRIVLDQKAFKAYLVDRVVLRGRPSSSSSPPAFEVRTGRAEVQFFEGFKPQRSAGPSLLAELASVDSFRAFSTPTERIAVEGEAFVARAEEATWSSRSRELRLHGEGLQEIEVVGGDLRGPVTAREIVYDDAAAKVLLRGEVRGKLHQVPSVGGSGWPGGGEKAEAGERRGLREPAEFGVPTQDTVWSLSTSILEAELEKLTEAVDGAPGPGASGAPALARGASANSAPGGASPGGAAPSSSAGEPSRYGVRVVRARDKVDLRNDDLGVQLRGDDLVYEHATRKIRIYSQDGRPQTLVLEELPTLQSGSAGAAPVGATAKVKEAEPASARDVREGREGREGRDGKGEAMKVVSQEIWILLYESPDALRAGGNSSSWLLVQFDKDVLATFKVDGPKSKGLERQGLGQIWKIVSETLTVRVDPTKAVAATTPTAARQIIPWAVATGKVVFTSGAYQATADRAVYEEPVSQITLFGTKARLLRNNEEIFAEDVIVVRQLESSVELTYSKGTEGAGSPR